MRGFTAKILIIIFFCDFTSCVDVTFEGEETIGYFLKPSPELPSPGDGFQEVPGGNEKHFTLLKNTSPGSTTTIKAHYGPFTTRQTIPVSGLFNYIPEEYDRGSINDTSDSGGSTGRIHQFSSDISAHLVVKELRRDNPILKVLFHTSSAISSNHGSRSQEHEYTHENSCVLLLVHLIDSFETLNTSCTPSDLSGTCLAEIVIPSIWWPPMDKGKTPKALKRMARVEYMVYPKLSTNGECQTLKGLLPRKHLADLPLSSSHGSYEEVRNDDFVSIMVPQMPIYPRSKVYVPVFLQPNPTYPIYVFVIRARVRSGLRIIGAQVSQPDKWTINLDLNSKRTSATVTVFVNEAASTPNPLGPDSSHEVFSWLLEVDADARYYDTGMITWNLRYVLDASMAEQYDFDDDNMKLTSRLDIQKDDIQAVLPIAKSSELMNTAVLNGKQVSRAMKVFIVSQSGEVSDVTLQSSCRSVDESILKVSSSCTSVYLDGSEIKGSQNTSVFVKYGTYTGRTEFVVWMPEFPLKIQVEDAKLSQIKNWRISRDYRRRRQKRAEHGLKSNSLKKSSNRSNGSRRKNKNRRKNLPIGNDMSSMRSYSSNRKEEDKSKGCRLRYQQTKVEVFAKFLAVDDSSGRESYLISRKTSLKITDLVKNFLRVSDSRMASLDGKILQGHQVGRTEVQVLSPITGRVIGAQEIRIGGDRVTITHLEATVITGLQLSVRQNIDPNFGYIAYTSVSHKLTTKYQEGLLDIKIHFSDGTSTPINEISDSSYQLSVESLDNNVIAFAPMARLEHPRVIAIGEGKGDLLRVALKLSKKCHKRRITSLSSINAYVNVDFSPDSKGFGDGYSSGDEDVQNDAYNLNIKLEAAKEKNRNERPVNDFSGFNRINGIDEPSVQAHQYQDGEGSQEMTPLWIGIYALLGVFGLAIVVFTISCMVFAVRYQKKKNVPVFQAKISEPETEHLRSKDGSDGDSITHAHDWVWLGRATLERNSMNTGCSQTLVPMADMNGNQTSVHGSSPNVCYRDRQPPCSSSQRSKTACRKSDPSHSRSTDNFRITPNPHINNGDAPIMAPPPNLTRVPSQKAVNVPSWVAAADAQANRQKRVKIHSNPMPSFQGVPLPAPVPPVRRLRNVNEMNKMSTFTIHCNDEPPPVPPHANLIQKEEKPDIEPEVHYKRGNKFKKSCDEAASAVEGEQPSPCADDIEQDGDWDSVRMGMDYDQLMEYFDNLKESNA